MVNQLRWLTPQQFLDGLSLGQLTPGPILVVAAFVGYQVASFWGAVVAAGAIFLPSFVLMFAVLPVLERIKHLTWMKAALKGVGSAAIGMIAQVIFQMLPHAVPDPLSALLALATVSVILLWRLSPLPLMAGGAAGLVLRGRSAVRPAQHAGDLVAVTRDPGVEARGQDLDAGQPEEEGQPAPAAQPAKDLRDRGVARQQAAVRQDELHGLHAAPLAHPGIARPTLGRLARQELELAAHRAPGDPRYPAPAEPAGPVIDQNRARPASRGLPLLELRIHRASLYARCQR